MEKKINKTKFYDLLLDKGIHSLTIKVFQDDKLLIHFRTPITFINRKLIMHYVDEIYYESCRSKNDKYNLNVKFIGINGNRFKPVLSDFDCWVLGDIDIAHIIKQN